MNYLLKRLFSKKIPFILPDIGEGITEVQILEWFVKEGDVVKQFQKIAEVQSDKATVEITSRYDGKIIKKLYDKGEIAKVGTPLLHIESDDQPTLENKSEQEEIVESSEKHKEPLKEKYDFAKALPAVRAFAKNNNVELSKVKGTGNRGEVTKKDVLDYLSMGKRSDISSTKELSIFQKAMIKSMKKSLEIPHFGYHDLYPIDNLEKFRKGLLEKMTIFPLLIKAISLALEDFSILNAHFVNENEILYIKDHSISIAVDTSHGLAVPSIKRVQDHSIKQISHQIIELVEKARNNKLTKEDLDIGSFSLSNIGSIGSGYFASPVILAPQVCIGAVCKSRIIEGKLMLPISWSADHRVIDGATIARFSNRLKEILENPSLLSTKFNEK